jgi:uncharacterized protein (DUF362 family)/NAD-dependent dihydropyrimidine dehydrogenase PreA subunit
MAALLAVFRRLTMVKLSAVECKSYDTEEVFTAVKEALRRIDFVIPENITVLIKPNIMSQNRPCQHTITHKSLVEALCRILQERNCRIQIGESISFYQGGLTRKAFTTSGLGEVAGRYGASLVAFEEVPLVRVSEGLVGLKELYIPKIILEADMAINACKMKTHSSMRLSGAVKNMFGCLPGGYKQKIHMWLGNEFELADVFVDIHNIVKPALSIMDAVVSLDGGPTALGRPVQTSRIFVSTNAAAIDIAAAKIIGCELAELPILLTAKKRGMIKSFEDVQVLGDIVPVKFRHLVKADPGRLFNKNSIFIRETYVDLAIDNAKCTKCEKCINACPAGAISASGGRIVLDKEICISCYYCLSVCPGKAVRIMPSRMNKLIRAARLVLRL